MSGNPNSEAMVAMAGPRPQEDKNPVAGHGDFEGWSRLESATRRGGGMVDAADLKSAVAKAAYGFESRPRHD